MIGIKTGAATKAIRAIDRKLSPLIEELGGRYHCLVQMPQPQMTKLSRFDAGTSKQVARPVFTMTAWARAQMIYRARERFGESLARGVSLSLMPVLMVAAQSFRETWVTRLATSGGDTPFRPLTPRYLARKQRLGLDTRTGIATGAMIEALRKGFVIVRKA